MLYVYYVYYDIVYYGRPVCTGSELVCSRELVSHLEFLEARIYRAVM